MENDQKNRNVVENEFNFKLTTYEEQGKLHIRWNSDGGFLLLEDRIVVFEKGFPVDAGAPSKAWTSSAGKNSWDTGLPYGSNWYCARIAQSQPHQKHVYVQKIITH